MIEYLEQLVEEKKYREAVKLAESLLRTVDNPKDLVRIHAAAVVSHCMLGELEAALAAGDTATSLAREIEDWDSFGKLSVWVGICYGRLGQLQEAVHRIYQYLGNMQYYQKRQSTIEAYAWFNLGVFQAALGEQEEASRSLTTALRVALRDGDLSFAQGVRRALIKNHLEAGSLEAVPRLLAQCACYLRRHPDTESHATSLAYHTQFRGEFALATGRVDRAELIAIRALPHVQGDSLGEYILHALLAKVAERKGRVAEAIGHSVAARTFAVAIRRTDLENEANGLLYAVMQTTAMELEAVEQHYLAGS